MILVLNYGKNSTMDIPGLFYTLLLSGLIVILKVTRTKAGAVQITSDNINSILATNELVFLNFYADWCRFSQILKPVFDEAATKVKTTFPEQGRVVLGSVNCDTENAIAAAYHVNKYPTLKVFRFGSLAKKEYRGQRSVESLSNFVAEQLKDSVQPVHSMDELDTIDRKKRHIIGYFESTEHNEYTVFLKIAKMLREDCTFHSVIGDLSAEERGNGNKVVFRPTKILRRDDDPDLAFPGYLLDYNQMLAWVQDKCVPLVREITFENAEELTEEGLPFVIMFHHPDDTETPEKYRQLVSKDLLGEKTGVNFLTADGLKFSHPLYHLGKSSGDLPVLAIDSFRHMYIFPHDVKTKVEEPGLLKQFIADLHSGKLHREYHHGPDPTPSVAPAPIAVDDSSNQKTVEQQQQLHVRKDEEAVETKPPSPTTPPESIFKKLAPSRTRYTVLKDEL